MGSGGAVVGTAGGALFDSNRLNSGGNQPGGGFEFGRAPNVPAVAAVSGAGAADASPSLGGDPFSGPDGSGRGFSGGGDAAAGRPSPSFPTACHPAGSSTGTPRSTAATRRCRGSTEPCPGRWVTCPCTRTGRRRWRARLSRMAGTTARRTGRRGCPRRSCPRMVAARRVPRTSTCDAIADVRFEIDGGETGDGGV